MSRRLDIKAAAAADLYMAGFHGSFDLLLANPLAGPAAEVLGRGRRKWRYRSHVIYYRVEREAVLILRILHHARDAPRLLN